MLLPLAGPKRGRSGRAQAAEGLEKPPSHSSGHRHGPAYEGDETRQLIFDPELGPVVPPKSNRLNTWEYDRELYRRRNEVERLFRRLKGFRRIFSRFEKLDVMFTAFIHIALIFEALLYLNRL